MEYAQSMSLWQLLLNILLTLPFGVYLHYYFKQSLPRTVLFSFLLSLFYEGSQLSALFGIYPGPYRLADVEDLICNTLGGADIEAAKTGRAGVSAAKCARAHIWQQHRDRWVCPRCKKGKDKFNKA